MSDQPRVMLGFTLYRHVAPLCTLSMLQIATTGVASGLVHKVEASVNLYLDRARNSLCEIALETGSTHILFVDQDMVVPNYALPRLVSLDVPVASGLYFQRERYTPVAFWLDQPSRRMEALDEGSITEVDGLATPLPCPCGRAPDHVHNVDGVGLGCCLISTSVLRRIAERRGDSHWFVSDKVGEDLHFARECARLGIPIALDGRVACGHITDTVVTQQHYQAMLEQRATIKG